MLLQSRMHNKDLIRWDLLRQRGQRLSEFHSTRKKKHVQGRLSGKMKSSSVIQKKETSFRGVSDILESSKGGVPIKLLSKYLHRCTQRVASKRVVVSFPEKRLASRLPGGSQQEIICEHPPHGWWWWGEVVVVWGGGVLIQCPNRPTTLPRVQISISQTAVNPSLSRWTLNGFFCLFSFSS